MMTQHLVLHGVTTCLEWAAEQDRAARHALRRLLPQHSAVAAVGSWGRQDGCKWMRPMAFIHSSRSHAAIIADELVAGVPLIKISVNSISPVMQVRLLDARLIWGEAELPAAQYAGQEAAEYYAQFRLRERAARTPAVEDWISARTILKMAGRTIPDMLDLPIRIQSVYTARNMGSMDDSDLMVDRGLLAERVVQQLQLLARGGPLASAAEKLDWLLCA